MSISHPMHGCPCFLSFFKRNKKRREERDERSSTAVVIFPRFSAMWALTCNLVAANNTNEEEEEEECWIFLWKSGDQRMNAYYPGTGSCSSPLLLHSQERTMKWDNNNNTTLPSITKTYLPTHSIIYLCLLPPDLHCRWELSLSIICIYGKGPKLAFRIGHSVSVGPYPATHFPQRFYQTPAHPFCWMSPLLLTPWSCCFPRLSFWTF